MARTKATQPELKIEEIEKALRMHKGIMSAAAKELNVTRSAISQRVSRSKKLQNVQKEIREKVLDLAESVVFGKMAQEMNLTASIFYLKCQGKERGYIENKNIGLENADVKTPFKIERVIVKSKNDTD